MQIDGKDYGTSSVTRGLARKRLAEAGDKSNKKLDEKSKEAEKNVVSANSAAIDAANSEHDHAGDDAPHDVIKGVVAEHGPAKNAEVMPDGEYHSVHTTHEDGHKHASHGHPHLPHVAEHLAHAAGAQDSDSPSQEPKDDDADGQPSAGPLSFLGNMDEETGE